MVNVTQAHLMDVRQNMQRSTFDPQQLKSSVNQLVSSTFFGTLMKIANNSVLKAEIGHGGRGEEMFQQQLNAVYAERIAGSDRCEIGEAIYREMMKHPNYAGTDGNDFPLLQQSEVVKETYERS